jgi:Na+/H+ antiporter NhaD/arsenite permease-like protein
MISMCVAALISVIVGIVLLYKCYQKRRVTQDIKNQMNTKKQLFASSLGISFFEINNDPRLTYTMHV